MAEPEETAVLEAIQRAVSWLDPGSSGQKWLPSATGLNFSLETLR